MAPPPEHAVVSHQPLLAWVPLTVGALAYASFVCMDVTIKSLATRHGALQLVFLRFASGSVFAVAIWLWRRPSMPSRAAWPSHALRSLLVLVTLASYYHSLGLLPLVQAAAMSYLAPIFVSVLATFWMHERPSRWRWAALALGFSGVAPSLGPERQRRLGNVGGSRLDGIAFAVLATVCYSFILLLARQQAQRDSIWTILLLQNLLPTLLLTLPASLSWQPLLASELVPIALASFFATIRLASLTWSFKHLEATRVAPLEYAGVVWAGGLGVSHFRRSADRHDGAIDQPGRRWLPAALVPPISRVPQCCHSPPGHPRLP